MIRLATEHSLFDKLAFAYEKHSKVGPPYRAGCYVEPSSCNPKNGFSIDQRYVGFRSNRIQAIPRL